jgi:hypothetical protein
MSKEVQDRLDGKYRSSDEQEINDWLDALGLGRPSSSGKEAFHEFLKDGTVLCKLANILQENAIRKVHDPSKIRIAAMRSMKEQENIAFFLKWCKSYGLLETDAFQTVYLYEASNLAQVQITLFKVGSLAKTKGFNGPTIGIKVAESNKRNFTQEQLKAGQFIPAQTSGNNKGASQAGMSSYGLGRQIVDNTAQQHKADQSTIGLQSGSNAAQKMINQARNYGNRREVGGDETSKQYNADYSTPGMQMGNNKGANQSGMSASGTQRQIM